MSERENSLFPFRENSRQRSRRIALSMPFREARQRVLAMDVDEDGLMDLYVGNDVQLNSLLINQPNGRFTDVSESSGAGRDDGGGLQASMGVAGADVDRNGRWDPFTTNFNGEFDAPDLRSAVSQYFDEGNERIETVTV